MSNLRDQLHDSLASTFTLERELTGGGMSRVFVAEERSLRRKVVVKVLPLDMAGGQISAERFRREIEIAAQLQYPHIVPVLAAGEAAGLPYFTMPYVRGESLRARLSAGGELPMRDAVRILRQVASALAFAHDAGVVHRDIKPDNVLISGDAAMVTDFGVAKALSVSTTTGEAGLTSLGVALGTPAYMSPEQASADPHVDHRADIYSWGVLAYELLTGSTPFAGRSPQAMLAAHTSEQPQLVSQRRPTIPASLARLIMRCLEKRPADRPQRAQELIQALDEISTPSGELSPSNVGTSRHGKGRTITLAAAGVLLLVVSTVVARNVSTSSPAATSAAVLPLQVVGGDTAVEYLAEGLSGSLSVDLQRRGVRVAPQASTYQLREQAFDPKRIASTLGVSTVFVGRLLPRGSTVLVKYDLVSADGSTLTQGSLEHDGRDAVGLESEILQDLLRVLSPPNGSAARANRGPTRREVDAETYDLYLRALHLRNSYRKEGMEKGIELFKEAIARDSTYAPLYAELGWTYMMLADAFYPPREVIPRALAAVKQALALDDSLATAHRNLGALYQQYVRDWTMARQEIERAIALNPGDAEAYLWRAANKLTLAEGNATAVDDIRRALRLDPLSTLCNFSAIWIFSSAGLPDSAIARYHRLHEIEPDFFYLEPFVDDAFRAKGQLDSALAIGEAASEREGRPMAGLIVTLVRLGRHDDALRRFRELEAFARNKYVAPELLARAALAVGDTTRAIEFLERGVESQSAMAQMLTWYGEFHSLLGNPRFEKHLARVHLTEPMHRLVQ